MAKNTSEPASPSRMVRVSPMRWQAHAIVPVVGDDAIVEGHGLAAHVVAGEQVAALAVLAVGDVHHVGQQFAHFGGDGGAGFVRLGAAAGLHGQFTHAHQCVAEFIQRVFLE